MKTQIYTTLIWMIFFILNANAQNSDNFSVIPSSSGNTSGKRVLITLGNTSQRSDHNVSYSELNLKQILQENNVSTENETINLLKIARDYMESLQSEADAIYNEELSVRLKARKKTGNERNALLTYANELSKQAEQKMIKASEIRGKINMEHYTSNKNHYNKLSVINRASAKITMEAESIYFEAERDMRIGTEMREEAYAMPNSSAKLGSMGNADESEKTALQKQDQAITILKQANGQ